MEVLRDGESLNVDVVPQRARDGLSIATRVWHSNALFPSRPLLDTLPGWTERRRAEVFGFKLVDVGESLGAYFGVDGGVLVLTAEDDSELLPGDILRRVGEDDVAAADAAYLALAEVEESTQIIVRRNGKRKVLTMEPIEGVKVRKSIEYREKESE